MKREYTSTNRYLYLMLGAPGSGKSEFSRQLCENISAVYFNSDRFREAIFQADVSKSYNHRGHAKVFGAMREATRQTLQVASVVWDVNNNRYDQRQANALLAREADAETVVVYVETLLEEAIRRTQTRDLAEGHNVEVPEEIIERMVRNIDIPREDERTIRIDGMAPFAEQLKEFRAQLKEMYDEQ